MVVNIWKSYISFIFHSFASLTEVQIYLIQGSSYVPPPPPYVPPPSSQMPEQHFQQ